MSFTSRQKDWHEFGASRELMLGFVRLSTDQMSLSVVWTEAAIEGEGTEWPSAPTPPLPNVW